MDDVANEESKPHEHEGVEPKKRVLRRRSQLGFFAISLLMYASQTTVPVEGSGEETTKGTP